MLRVRRLRCVHRWLDDRTRRHPRKQNPTTDNEDECLLRNREVEHLAPGGIGLKIEVVADAERGARGQERLEAPENVVVIDRAACRFGTAGLERCREDHLGCCGSRDNSGAVATVDKGRLACTRGSGYKPEHRPDRQCRLTAYEFSGQARPNARGWSAATRG